MRLLPTGKYDYDLFPITEQMIEIDADGNDEVAIVEKLGVIDVADEDLDRIRFSRKFSDDLDMVVDMTDEEIGQEERNRAKLAGAVEIDALTGKLESLGYLTDLFVEGKLADEEWRDIVAQRDMLRRRIDELRTVHGG